MMGIAIFLTVTTSLVCVSSPSIFRLFDHRIAHARTKSSGYVTHSPVQVPTPENHLSHADVCDALATAIRAGHHPLDALTSLASQNVCPPVLRHVFSSAEHSEYPLDHTLKKLQSDSQGTADELLTLLLLLSCRSGTFSATALNTAASCLRDEETAMADIRVGTAHARITSRILTTLPLASLVFGCVVSPSLRHAMQSPGLLTLLCVGLGLNVAGWLWMRSIADDVVERSTDDSLHTFTFALCVSLQAGNSLVSACQSWAHISPLGESVAAQLAHGVPLHTAVSDIAQHCGPRGHALSRILVESVESGTPLASVVSRLFSEEQQDTKRRVETRLRQLPTKLSLPIVFCVLPSFLLIALMPFVLIGLTSLPRTSLT